MRKIRKLAEAGNGQPLKDRVRFISKSTCLKPTTVYQLLQELELADRLSVYTDAIPQPGILQRCLEAPDPLALALQAIEEGWTAARVRTEASRLKALAREAANGSVPREVDVRVTDARDLLRTARDVEAIITDPPYQREALPLYGELAVAARATLAPNGILAVMCGQSYLPEVLGLMAPVIPYRWTMAYLTPGGQAVQAWERKVNTFWKPILLFGAAREWLGDVVRSEPNDNDKRYHDWGQSESGMRALIERLTVAGDLVCDPYCGAGTTGVAAMTLGRRFIGGDTDAAMVEITRARLRALV